MLIIIIVTHKYLSTFIVLPVAMLRALSMLVGKSPRPGHSTQTRQAENNNPDWKNRLGNARGRIQKKRLRARTRFK